MLFIFIGTFLLQEICARPKFISESTSRFDIEQGELGKSEIVLKNCNSVIKCISGMYNNNNYYYYCYYYWKINYISRIFVINQYFFQFLKGKFVYHYDIQFRWNSDSSNNNYAFWKTVIYIKSMLVQYVKTNK